ncbi:MAG: cupin domain-containing protein [Rhizobiaceae bacterium]
MPLKAGSTTTNPKTGSIWKIIEGDQETGGKGFTIEVTCPPDSGQDVLEHLHLDWVEEFEIISGKAKYRLDGVEKTAKKGDRITMPPGQPHIHPWNDGKGKMTYHQIVKFETSNPEAFQDVIGAFFTMFGLAGEGKAKEDGMPKNLLQFAATIKALTHHRGYDASAPIFLQNLTGATLGTFAGWLGYRAVYPRYLNN